MKDNKVLIMMIYRRKTCRNSFYPSGLMLVRGDYCPNKNHIRALCDVLRNFLAFVTVHDQVDRRGRDVFFLCVGVRV